MFSLRSPGSFDKTAKFLDRLVNGNIYEGLEMYGRIGVDALAYYTPKDTGLTASSWGYNIIRGKSEYTIEWFNTNVNQGVQIAIIIQYGHGTGTGGYVAGTDYINPALIPIFDQIADDVWKKVTA